MLSANKTNTTLAKLKKVDLVPPENAGFRWKGVKHIDFIHAIHKVALTHGYTPPADPRLRVWLDGRKMCGALPLTRKKAGPVTPWIGFMSSNAGDKMVRFYAGGVEDATGTTVVLASWTGGSYTLNFDINAELSSRSFDTWMDAVEELPAVVARLKATTLSADEYAKLLFSVGRKKVLPMGRVMAVDAKYREAKMKTLWGFQTAVTEAVTLTSGPRQMDRLLGSYKLLCGFQHKTQTTGV